MTIRLGVQAGLAFALVAGVGIAAQGEQAAPTITPPPINFFAQPGYLPQGAMPDSLVINPAPPAPGSGNEARDIEAQKAALALRGSARWDLARRDADLFSSTATGTFACAAGVAISQQTTPLLVKLMNRSVRDLAMVTRPTKNKYMRQRPFVVNGQPSCTPEAEAALRTDGSYPSGHSAIGWGWGLVLAEVVPSRSAQLVARGRAFGDSRRVCNVHWLSDAEEGGVLAAAAVARMHAEPAFLADVAAARAEVAALAGKAPPSGCADEAAALAMH